MPPDADIPGTSWQGEDGLHLDLRGLSPPEPMVAVLTTLDATEGDGPIFAHLSRDPIYLYPELAEIGWKASPLPAEPGEVLLRLTRQT